MSGHEQVSAQGQRGRVPAGHALKPFHHVRADVRTTMIYPAGAGPSRVAGVFGVQQMDCSWTSMLCAVPPNTPRRETLPSRTIANHVICEDLSRR